METTFSILIVWKNGSVNEFHGVTDISFQMRGVDFPSFKVWKSRNCYIQELAASTNTQRVTLISPKTSDNDGKQSNYRLIKVLNPNKAKVINDRRKKRHDFIIYFSRTCILLNVKVSISTKSLESFLDQSTCVKSDKM